MSAAVLRMVCSAEIVLPSLSSIGRIPCHDFSILWRIINCRIIIIIITIIIFLLLLLLLSVLG